MNYLHSNLTGQVLKCFFHVYNTLGYGFLEKVYERALIQTLKKSGLSCENQVPIDVYFEGEKVGQFYADIVVNDVLILELKQSKI